MKKLLGLILLAGAIFVSVWGWKKLFPGDVVLIRRLIEQTAQTASFGGQQKDLSRMAGAGDLAKCFTEDAVVKIDALGGEFSTVRGRAQVQQLALLARQQMASLSVQFSEVEITMEGKDSALARVVATAKGAGMTEPYHRELKLGFRKQEGEWRIARLESVRALQRVD